MRIRQLKPTYFLDKTLWTKCRAETREFYQGLWLIADDAGWFEWDVASIATELYRFVGVAKRERDVERHAAILQALQPDEPHLILHPCGHAEVPKMPQHQRITDSKKVRSDFDRHRSDRCPAFPRGTPRNPADALPGKERERVGKGKEQVAGAQAQDEPTPFRTAMAANGFRR
jgi:hypothetical protein